MTRRAWAKATYSLARAVGHDRPMSLALAYQGYRYGPKAEALLTMAQVEERTERLVVPQVFIDGQRIEAPNQ